MKPKKDHSNLVMTELLTMLSLVSFILIILVALTDLGKIDIFRFVVGEMVMLTAIAFSFQAARQKGKLAPLLAVIWFSAVSINFAQAIGLIAK